MPKGFVIPMGGDDEDENPFAEMLRQVTGGGSAEDFDDNFRPKIDEDAAIMRLMEAFGDYKKDRTFTIGDLVTPKKQYATKAPGTPCIVVEVRKDADFNFNMDGSSGSYGEKEDMRVLRFVRHPSGKGEMIVSFWVESWQYEYHPKSDKFSSAG